MDLFLLLFTLFTGIIGVVFVAGSVVIILWMWSLTFTQAPFVPVPHNVIPHIIEALAIRQGSVVYDLGCGDGRILINCYKNQPLATYIGLDRAFIPFLLACRSIKRFGSPPTISILRKNFFHHDCSNATHIFTYLFPKLMDHLLPKLEQELKPGTRLVSCDFQFSKKQPKEVIPLNRPKRSLGQTLYVYEF